MTETVLIVVVILLILYVAMGKRNPCNRLSGGQVLRCSTNDGKNLRLNVTDNAMTNGASNNTSNDTPNGVANTADDAPENYETMINKAMRQNVLANVESESFQVCGGYSPEQLKATCEDSTGAYVQGYGNEGLDYNAYAASQAVDTQVIRNHGEFIKNVRGLGPNGEFTGRTYSPDSHDSYDPIPWIGLRRPEAVNVCNPTTVPDVDYNLYKGNRKFCLVT